MSQYLALYLSENRERGWGRGLTPRSYLAYTLRGRAKHYSAQRALARALEAAETAGGAICGWSTGREVAWYPPEALAGVPEPPTPSRDLPLTERARLASETLRGQRRGECGPIRVKTGLIVVGIDRDLAWLADAWQVPVLALELAWAAGCGIIDNLRTDERGRLHGVDEPALVLRPGTWHRPRRWQQGIVTSRAGRGEVRAWHGTLLTPADLALARSLTPADIARGGGVIGASSIEARRAILEMLLGDDGTTITNEAIIGALGARVIDVAPEHKATLLTTPPGLQLLLLRCHSTDRPYILRVPSIIRRARQALAWTFGLEERDYAPLMES
ncbi:MAG: hypothetical protein KatS3mg015_2846 [Fimbriimonadales bacterium]|nr:MAG: hypothetical protein KatS3mg015_2846 [Fimbriimonadales bacterium]